MIQETACLRLELENRPENVALVRAALSGLAEAGEFDEELSTDLRTAVSEACNNVVIHAYEGSPGPMRVMVRVDSCQIDAVVADYGTGIRRLSGATDHMGLGLALISALADQAEFASPHNGGTEVRMQFRRTERELEGATPHADDWSERPVQLAGDVVLSCQPVTLLRHLFGRVARALAASAHFTISGASDLYAVNDAVAEYAEFAGDGEVVMAMSGSEHRLTLDAGPFLGVAPATTRGGAVAELDTADALDHTSAELAGLVDQLSFEPLDGGKLMHMLLFDSGRQATGD